MLRFLLWRTLAIASVLVGLSIATWLLSGGPGRVLRSGSRHGASASLARELRPQLRASAELAREAGVLVLVGGGPLSLLAIGLRARARSRRRYVRRRVLAYRLDTAEPVAVERVFATLHGTLQVRWWQRLLSGQPSLSVEAHFQPTEGSEASQAWLAMSFPAELERAIEASLQVAYPNTRLQSHPEEIGAPRALVRLAKQRSFVTRLATPEKRATGGEPLMDALLRAMQATGAPVFAQLALTPTPACFERFSRSLFRSRERRVSRRRHEHLVTLDRSMLVDAELRGGLEVQHRALFFAELRIAGQTRAQCRSVGSVLRARRGENALGERGTTLRQGLLYIYGRRLLRGEGNAFPRIGRDVLACSELAELWQLPSVGQTAVPMTRSAVPLAPASPSVFRPVSGAGSLRDSLGAVSIHPELRRQNTAVPGTVDQGKTSFLVATMVEDLARERCAVIVLDPKGDAADAALSAVPPHRRCTLVDFAHPTCGFNPLAVDAPADVIADYVVASMKQLFSDSEIRASSDRYLRNAIIAVLSYDRSSTLWDAARLLSVGSDGYAYRRHVGARVRALPELKEISQFFTEELSAQLADARGATTAKLDAPVNKLARLLNSPSTKRLLLNRSLVLDFDRAIVESEVVIVKGALGAMGAGNTSVLMQLLLGMLDAALARQQDEVPEHARTAVALKIDEAPLVINRGFAETMALKRSAGLETVACWQSDAQWVDREMRDQLDALFAHRVSFATASARESREGAALAMAEFSDSVRPNMPSLSALGRPDVRLRLPKHHALVSLTTPQGRQPAFIAQTIPMRVNRDRLAAHVAAQLERGGRYLESLDQPHWEPRAQHRDEHLARRAAQSLEVPPRSASKDEERAHAPSSAATPDSFAELVALDEVRRVRQVRRGEPRQCKLDELDLEVLALVADLGPLLSSQLHRRFGIGKATTTTQRRLKRLADAGLVERLQLHRSDGGGAPMCYSIAPGGVALLQARGVRCAPELLTAPVGAEGELELLVHVRNHVRVAGWALALGRSLSIKAIHGRAASAVAVPRARNGSPLGPQQLVLARGAVAHEFLRTVGGRHEEEVERFQALRADATVVLRGSRRERERDIFIDLEGREGREARRAKVERYDHFLSGWCSQLARYDVAAGARAQVVIVCRDADTARRRAREADELLRACHAYPGERPQHWLYPGRRDLLFAAERDAHGGCLHAWGVPPLPPRLRADVEGSQTASEHTAQKRLIGEARDD